MDLPDFYSDFLTKEAQIKIARMLEECKDDPERLTAFYEILSQLRKAQDIGKVPMLNPSEVVSAAIQLIDTKYSIPFHRVLIRRCKRCDHVGLKVLKEGKHASGKFMTECEHCEHRQLEEIQK